MIWTAILTSEVEEWFLTLDDETVNLVTAAIDQLEADGPTLGRPLVDRIKGSKVHNLKETAPRLHRHQRDPHPVRLDPKRQAVLLVAGDKAGPWTTWYPKAIKAAERQYAAYLKEIDNT